jgi:hypothetical protein
MMVLERCDDGLLVERYDVRFEKYQKEKKRGKNETSKCIRQN